MTNQADVELVNDSLERCPNQPDFFESFYLHFRNSSDVIAAKFDKTNARAQSRALRESFYLLFRAVGGDPEAWQQLELRALRHDRKHLDISPWMYQVWVECLIETIREFDPGIDSDTESAWRRIMQQGIDFMIARY
jgi:hemoglobin-like flavoprotein